MSKRLVLMRHAHAPHAFQLSDHDRPLSALGEAQAKAVGQYLAGSGQNIDLALISSAQRAQTTGSIVLSCLNHSPVTSVERSLYNAPLSEYWALIQSVPQDMNTVLVVAHNPTIHRLALALSGDEKHVHYNKISLSYPPATLAILSCPIGSWLDIKEGANMIEDAFIVQ